MDSAIILSTFLMMAPLFHKSLGAALRWTVLDLSVSDQLFEELMIDGPGLNPLEKEVLSAQRFSRFEVFHVLQFEYSVQVSEHRQTV